MTRSAAFSLLAALLLAAALPLRAQTYVFAGDSITDGGWGASGGRGIPTAGRNLTDLNHLYGHSYMMLVASDWQSAYPATGLVFHNRGLSGDTLEGLAAPCLRGRAKPCRTAGWCSGPRFSLLWDDSGHVMITRSGPPA